MSASLGRVISLRLASGRMTSNLGGAGAVVSTSTPDCAMAAPAAPSDSAIITAALNTIRNILQCSQIWPGRASETLSPRKTCALRSWIGGSISPAEGEERAQVPSAIHPENRALERVHTGRRHETRCVVAEFCDHLIGSDGHLGAPALALLVRLEHPAVPEPHLDPAGEGSRIGGARIYRVSNSSGQRESARLADALLGEGADTHTIADQGRGDAEREAELGVVRRPWTKLGRGRLADDGHFASGHETLDFLYLLRSEAFGLFETGHGVKIGVVEMAAR